MYYEYLICGYKTRITSLSLFTIYKPWPQLNFFNTLFKNETQQYKGRSVKPAFIDILTSD